VRRGLVAVAAAVGCVVAGCGSETLTARSVSRSLQAHGLRGLYIDNLRKPPRTAPTSTAAGPRQPLATLPNIGKPATFPDLGQRGVHYLVLDATMGTWAYVFDDAAQARRFFGHAGSSIAMYTYDGSPNGRIFIVRNVVVQADRLDVHAARQAVAELSR
jgi:hypothetical protein